MSKIILLTTIFTTAGILIYSSNGNSLQMYVLVMLTSLLLLIPNEEKYTRDPNIHFQIRSKGQKIINKLKK